MSTARQVNPTAPKVMGTEGTSFKVPTKQIKFLEAVVIVMFLIAGLTILLFGIGSFAFQRVAGIGILVAWAAFLRIRFDLGRVLDRDNVVNAATIVEKRALLKMMLNALKELGMESGYLTVLWFNQSPKASLNLIRRSIEGVWVRLGALQPWVGNWEDALRLKENVQLAIDDGAAGWTAPDGSVITLAEANARIEAAERDLELHVGGGPGREWKNAVANASNKEINEVRDIPANLPARIFWKKYFVLRAIWWVMIGLLALSIYYRVSHGMGGQGIPNPFEYN